MDIKEHIITWNISRTHSSYFFKLKMLEFNIYLEAFHEHNPVRNLERRVVMCKYAKGTESLVAELNMETQLQCKIHEELLGEHLNTKEARRGDQRKLFWVIEFELALQEWGGS